MTPTSQPEPTFAVGDRVEVVETMGAEWLAVGDVLPVIPPASATPDDRVWVETKRNGPCSYPAGCFRAAAPARSPDPQHAPGDLVRWAAGETYGPGEGTIVAVSSVGPPVLWAIEDSATGGEVWLYDHDLTAADPPVVVPAPPLTDSQRERFEAAAARGLAANRETYTTHTWFRPAAAVGVPPNEHSETVPSIFLEPFDEQDPDGARPDPLNLARQIVVQRLVRRIEDAGARWDTATAIVNNLDLAGLLVAPAGVPPEQERPREEIAIDLGLLHLLTDLTVAAGRMRDNWAEGDDAVKAGLWRALHAAADAAESEVYPLASEDPAAAASPTVLVELPREVVERYARNHEDVFHPTDYPLVCAAARDALAEKEADR